MTDTIMLGLAQRLLRLLAAKMFKGKIQAIMDHWDATPVRFWPSGTKVRRSRDLAAYAVLGRMPTPNERVVLGLLYDPIRAARG
jgi:hypothetical protein